VHCRIALLFWLCSIPTAQSLAALGRPAEVRRLAPVAGFAHTFPGVDANALFVYERTGGQPAAGFIYFRDGVVVHKRWCNGCTRVDAPPGTLDRPR
jgi:hypothetical protein